MRIHFHLHSRMWIASLLAGVAIILLRVDLCQSKHLIQSKTVVGTNTTSSKVQVSEQLAASKRNNNSRVQTKRQAESTSPEAQSAGRAGDPWFLDSEPPYPPQPYRFVYNVKGRNGLTEQYRQEVGDGKYLTGSYGYVLPDGIYRHVDYIADDRGFRAFIRTSEPGTANQNPADVVINSNPVPQQPFASNPQSIAASIAANAAYPASNTQWIGSSAGVYLPPTAGGSTFSGGGGLATTFGSHPPSGSAQSLNFGKSSPNAINNSSSGPILSDYWAPLHTGFTTDYPSSGLIQRRPPGSIVNGNYSQFSQLQSPNLTSTFSNLPPPVPFGVSELNGSTRPKYSESAIGKVPWSSANSNKWPPESSLSRLFATTSSPLSTPETATERQPELTRNWPSPLTGYSGLLPLSPPVRPSSRSTLSFSDFGPTSTSLHPPTRTNKLSYDRLEGELRMTEPVAPKISYDGRQWANLNLQPVSPTSNSLGHLTNLPPESHPSLAPIDPTSGNLHYTPLSSVSQFSSRSSESSTSGGEEHRSRSTSSKTLDSLDKREQVSGREQGSGSQYGSTFTRIEQQSGGSQPDQQQQHQFHHGQHQNVGLIPPPAPQFGPPPPPPPPPPPTGRGPSSGSVKSLQAPYSQLSLPEAPSQPEEPSSPTTGDLFANAPVKGGPSFNRAAWPPTTPSPQVSIRTVRMPEQADELRSSMLMHDWRSMQNALGLPQPPRGGHRVPLQPQHHSEEPYLSRALRIDAILAGRGAGQASSPPAALSSPLEPAQSTTIATTTSTTTTTTTKAPAHQPPELRRPLNTGPLVKLDEIDELSGQLGASGNLSDSSASTSALFDARRLSGSLRPTTERPSSELEKFQQRLRTQQLLLEQAKQQPAFHSGSNRSASQSNNQQQLGAPVSSLRSSQRAGSNGAENSHVSYDDVETELVANTISGSTSEEGRSAKPKAPSTSGGGGGGGYKWLEISGPLRVSDPERSRLDSTSTQSSSATPLIPPLLKLERLSEFAKNVQSWPSLSSVAAGKRQQVSNNIGSNSTASASSKTDREKLTAGSEGGSSLEVEGALESPKNTSSMPVGSSSQKRGNTINLDFINSVTALSVDDMNPFAIASVNPAIQNHHHHHHLHSSSNREAARSNRDQTDSHTPTSGRLQMHKLSGEQQPAGSAPPNLATSNARYFSSPELLAALAYHERRETSSQLRNLVAAPPSGELAPTEGVSAARSSGWASNHRFAVAPSSSSSSRSPPYMLSAAASSSTRTESPEVSVAASNKLLVKRAEGESSSNAKLSPRSGLFEVRDREIHLDNQRFYEVLSSSSGSQRNQPLESSSIFTAFKDAQLSIPALVSRRR